MPNTTAQLPQPTGNVVTLGSLFTGYGGLDAGVAAAIKAVFGFTIRTEWVSDVAPGACKVIAARMPGIPNLGDITTVDWTRVPHVDVLCGGSPCQDVSQAGPRSGMVPGTRSNLWINMREAIAHLHPTLVVWENVKGAYSARASSNVEQQLGLLDDPGRDPSLRALGRVLGDLSDLGYDTQWCSLRASDVGAPHQRSRVFVVARLRGEHRGLGWGRTGRDDAHPHHPGLEGRAAVTSSLQQHAWEGPLGASPNWVEPFSGGCAACGGIDPDCGTCNLDLRVQHGWGKWNAAIRRWARLTGAEAPPAFDQGRDRLALTAWLPEWMQGIRRGWITDVEGISRREAIILAGNGVCPPQAAAAVEHLLHLSQIDTPEQAAAYIAGVPTEGPAAQVIAPAARQHLTPAVQMPLFDWDDLLAGDSTTLTALDRA